MPRDAILLPTLVMVFGTFRLTRFALSVAVLVALWGRLALQLELATP